MATVLVVDDEPAGRELIKVIIEHAGHRALTAPGGAAALGILAEESVDLLIADILMPDMDGYDLVRRLRLEEGLENLPVVFYSATYVAEEARELGEICGVSDVLVKPVEPNEVQRVVEAALARGPVVNEVSSEEFDRRHMRIVNRKLLEKVLEKQRLEAQLDQARRMESLGQLAGGVAHDFNNLLVVILNYADFVGRELEERPDLARVREDVEEIRKAAERAAALTRHLLVFSRREVARPVVVDLNALIADTEKLLRRTLGEHVVLETELDPDLRRVEVDPGHIGQLLVNLAVNSRDAMRDGGNLTITTGNTRLDEERCRSIAGGHPGDYISLTVADTGAGMSPETAERVFEPFFTTKPEGEGTGLGLATVYGIVAQAEGHISLHSEIGAGTTVEILLPATDSPVGTATAEPGEPETAGGETILLVEDEDSVREMVRRIFVRGGYEVVSAASGDEAVEIAADGDREIDLLLSDVVMPGMSGREVGERVRELRPRLPVLFMSGYTGRSGGEDRLGPEEIIQKPFTASSLLKRVHEALHAPGDGSPNGG